MQLGENDPVASVHPGSVENVIKPIIKEACSLLLKNYPIFRLQPFKFDDFDLSDEMNKHVVSAWQESQAMSALEMSLLESLKCGMSIIEVGWDRVRKCIRLTSAPRADCWAQPRGQEINDGYFIRRTWHTREQLERRWGADKIREALEDNVVDKGMIRRGLDKVLRKTGAIEKEDEDLPDYWNKVEDLYPVFTAWIPPDTAWEVVGEDKSYSPPAGQYGKRVVAFHGVKLSESDNPFAKRRHGRVIGHGKFPYVLHRCYREHDDNGYCGFYDVGGVASDLEQIQADLNDLSVILMEIGRRALSPAWVQEEGSLRHTDADLALTPGKMVSYGREAQRPPTPITTENAAQVQYLHEAKKKSIRESSGVREFMVGEQPRGMSHTTATGIGIAQEASFARMWTIVRQLDKTILDLATLMLGNMQQFYPLGKFSAVAVDGERWFGEWQQVNSSAEFRVEVVSGMTTPLRDLGREQRATQIYNIAQQAFTNPTIDTLTNLKMYLNIIQDPIVTHQFQTYLDQRIAELSMQEKVVQQMVEQNPQMLFGGGAEQAT
jgi:hypothetical protein